MTRWEDMNIKLLHEQLVNMSVFSGQSYTYICTACIQYLKYACIKILFTVLIFFTYFTQS